MSIVEAFKIIYNGPFLQYLRLSEKIGGTVYEQSKLVDILFLLEINLVDVTQKYKKPIHEQEENIFFEPIAIQIEKIKKFRIENNSSPFICQLSLISESTEIFEWIRQKNIEESLNNFEQNIAPFINKLTNQLLKLDMIHADWLYSWKCCLEDMNGFLTNFYKDGLAWVGQEKLPQQILLGDMSAVYQRAHHLKLLQEINQGENITNMLRQIDDENEQTNIDEQVTT